MFEQGGLLVTGPKWGPEGNVRSKRPSSLRCATLWGRADIAVAKEALAIPDRSSVDIQFLLSHANDVAKLFNASASGGFHYTASPDGKRALLQLLSVLDRRPRGGLATAWTRHKYRSAQLLDDRCSAATWRSSRLQCEDGGTEYHLPPMPAYVALDFEV